MSIEHMKQALLEKNAAGSAATNEDETVPGKLQVHKDPPGYTRSEKGGDVGFSTAAEEEAREGREGMVSRLFNGSHKPRRGHTKTASVEDETLTDQVRRVTGMR